MSKKDEALKLALGALEKTLRCHGVMLLSDPPQDAWKYHRVEQTAHEAIAAIREALAEQPAHQKPVAWRYLTQYESGASIWTYCAGEPANREIRQPLYTSPPASKPWVGLTDEEMRALKQKSVDDGMNRLVSDFEYIRSIEAKLREKNG